MAARSLLSKLPSLSSSPLLAARSASTAASRLCRLRPLLALADLSLIGAGVRCFSTRPTTSSLNDPAPNWSNRPPKETILLEGCDFEHWLVVVEPPEPNLTRDDIINIYIKTLAQVVGSEEEARMKIYSVSTKHYFAFGALVSEELSYKIKELSNVRWVLPDSYLDVRNKDYGGEPFIDGQAVPYHPKYHEEWVRNDAQARDRSKNRTRPRNNDRYERRRENVQNYRDAPPMPGNVPLTNSGNAPPTPNRDFNAAPPNNSGPPGTYAHQMPNPQGSYGTNSGVSVPPAGPGYQGNTQGYKGGSPVGGFPSGQGYQGGPGGYQGGRPSYQEGGGPNYQQGGNPGYQQQGYPQTGPNYQQSRPSYPPGGPSGPAYPSPPGPSYQQAGPGVGGPSYQQAGRGIGSPTYQSLNVPSYQQGGQGVGPPYQGQDMPGRDQ